MPSLLAKRAQVSDASDIQLTISSALRGFKMPVRWAALAVRWRLRGFMS
jgi:hypothetical protein